MDPVWRYAAGFAEVAELRGRPNTSWTGRRTWRIEADAFQMSIKALEDFTAELPYALREQVSDYARSVRDAAPEICRDAGVEPSVGLAEDLMWLAAVRRLQAILSSAFWTVDGANRLLTQQEAGKASVGSTDYSEDSAMYGTLSVLHREFETLIRELRMTDLVRLPWAEAAQVLADGRRSS